MNTELDHIRHAGTCQAVLTAAEQARICSCGSHAAIVLFKVRWRCSGCNVVVTARTHGCKGCTKCTEQPKLPACGPCAVALIELGWSPERDA